MHSAWRAIAFVLLLALLVFGVFGTMVGAMLGAGEARRMPAILGGVALFILCRGAAALPAASGWAVLGAFGAVAGRAMAGSLGPDGWLPGDDMGLHGMLAEALWWAVVGLAAWRGVPDGWLGPGLALLVGTTRIGGFGQALVPILWEDTLREAALLAVNIVAGFAAGLITVLLAGWVVAILAGIPARLAAPRRVLAALAAVAAIGHMLRV